MKVFRVAAVVGAGIAILLIANGYVSSQGPSTKVSSVVVSDADARVHMASIEIQELPKVLSFHPLLPRQLPPGYSYFQVVWPPAPAGSVDGFGVFVIGPDPALGTRAIHIHEGRGRPSSGSKADPVLAFANVTHREILASGDWQVMQKPHGPWLGEWIYMTWRGDLYVEVDGLAPKEVVQAVAASLQ